MLRRAVGLPPDREGWEMVRAEIERVARIEGGFVLVPVAGLVHAWHAARMGTLGIGDFRAWLACREMVARRCLASQGRAVAYDLAELAGLLAVTTKRARASVRRLEVAGMIRWSTEGIAFLDQEKTDAEPASVSLTQDTIGRGVGSIAVPRRMLRFLAAEARPALIATALGVLLRCLSRRKAGWCGRGRVKASWLASTFGVSLRQAKAARAELVDLGWIEAEVSDQTSMNRWGRAYRINLGWQIPATSAVGARSSPPPPARRLQIVTPSVDPEPLAERQENQEPGPGPAGASLGGEGGITQSQPVTVCLRPRQASPGEGHQGDPSSPCRPATLDDVQVADLKDTGRLLDVHRQAVAKGLVSDSEADRLRFMASAEHALAVGKANPPGLFAYLIRSRAWRYATQDDEDRAMRRLRDHGRRHFGANPSGMGWKVASRHAESTCPLSSKTSPAYSLSEDARFVREIRAATIRAGVFRDPFPVVCARDPGWTRERWDRAMGELGSG